MAKGQGPAIEVRGVKELNRALQKATERSDQLKEIHQRLGVPLAGLARLEAPTLTGTLAGTIRTSASKRALGLRVGSKRVPYAGPIHYGWPSRGITPNPFLERARDEFVPQAIDGYTRHVEELIDQINRESL